MRIIENFFTESQLQEICSLPEVIEASTKLSTQSSVYFTISLTDEIRDAILNGFGIDLQGHSEVPCRWMKGDTPAHIDRGQAEFEDTYLVYLTAGDGEFVLGDDSYPIKAGEGFSFSEGLTHEVTGTNGTSRLLLGPMSEQGFAVGLSISVAQGNTVYFRMNGSNVEYSTNNQASWNNVGNNYPLSIQNATMNPTQDIIVEFVTDMTFDDTAPGGVFKYFICASTNIQFGSQTLKADGTKPKITISGVTSYPGLIQNGSSGGNGKNYISVYNLDIVNSSSTLAGDAGWIGQTYFARGSSNNLIVNCSSDGDIPAHAGGIVGQFSANNGGSLTIRSCYSTGAIGSSAGGIIAESCSGSTNSVITIERCWSSGTIGTSGGGMTGNSSGINGGSVTCTNCYSTGSIGGNGGGIFGITNGYGTNGSATATNCYSTGDIAGSGGGIFGGNAATGSGSTSATNCYSTGTISSGGGGIYGSNYSATGAAAYHCYTSGSTSLGTKDGVWAGSSSDSVLGANNYGEGNHNSSGWSDNNAKTYLTGYPSATSYGTSWSQPSGLNTAYILSISGYSPYSTTLTNSLNASVTAGNSTTAGIVSGYTYSFLQINNSVPGSFTYISINSSTGAITASSSTPAATYTILVYSTKNPYGISTYVITVSEAPPSSNPSTTTTTCCVSTMDQRGLDYAQINDYRIGNRLLLEVSQNSKTKFDGYSEYVKYKMAQGSRKY